MLINNIDISNFNAKLLKKDIQTAEVVVYEDWLRKALSPIILDKKEKYKKINIELLIKSSSDQQALTDISNIIKQAEICTLKFKDLDFYYDASIENKSHKRIRKGIYKLQIDFKSSFAYKEEITETLSHEISKTINVAGNLKTPAIVEITPTIDLIEIIITGLGEDFTVSNQTSGQTVIINGEEGTVTENGANKFLDYDGWEYPALEPGANTITLTNANCNISINYKPRWI